MLYNLNKDLQLEKAPWYAKYQKTMFILNIGFLLIFIYGSFTPSIVDKIIIETKTVIMPEDIKLTDEAITQELVELGCVLPNVALAQMKIESSHFKSAICNESKNIAGIRTSSSKYVKRGADGKPIKNRGHNVYNTYKDCLKDYVRIQNRYLSKIDGKYAEASGYIDLIKKMK